MNEIAATIRRQIENCKGLLGIFQDERKTYQEKRHLEPRDIMEILKRKKQIFDMFEEQHSSLKEMNRSAEADNSMEKKELLSNLSSIIEQLLVIDHENEKLLREQMSSRPAISSGASAFARERPALQRQLPFVPGGQMAFRVMAAQAAVAEQNKESAKTAARAESVKLPDVAAISQPVEVSRPRPRAQLRNYAQAAQLLQFAPKYA